MRFTLLVSGLLAACCPAVHGADDQVDFATDIQPIFAANCTTCHGEERGLARLRLHSPDAITEALEVHDDLVAPGEPDDSQLYARLILPEDNLRRMPKGADPLPEEQIALIKQWIQQGAEFTSAGPSAEESMDESEEPGQAEPQALPERPPLQPAAPEAIEAVEQTGALVLPLYAGAAELRVSFPSNRDEVNDQTVAALLPLADQLVELDLSGTQITDQCAESLARLTNLDTLHLEKTAIGDAAVVKLVDLPYLNYLNLHTTNATDKALEALAEVKSLRKLYLWQCDVSYEAAKRLEQATPGLEVNLGWDHPGVVRERLKEELTRVKQRQQAATETIAKAEETLESARADKQAADERAAEIGKQLEALDQPAEQDAEQAPPAEQASEQRDAA